MQVDRYQLVTSSFILSAQFLSYEFLKRTNEINLTPNRYLKRGALGAVFNSVELFMIQDKSPDFQDTWAFLDKRIQDMVHLGNIKNKIDEDINLLLDSAYLFVTSRTK